MANMKIMLMILIFGASVSSVTGKCKEVSLKSRRLYLKRHLLKDAAKVGSMELIKPISETECTEGKTYGFLGPVVWVSNGCAAKFKVCYIEGRSILKRCRSFRARLRRCAVSSTKTIQSVIIERHFSRRRPCIAKKTFSFNDHAIFTKNGCQAVFRVGLTDKPTHT